MVRYVHMQQKNIFLLLALSGSVLMVMLVSTLLFIPHSASLQANITADPSANQVTVQVPEEKFYQGREPDEILKTIQQYVQDNNPDAAKKLYEELYMAHQNREVQPMGGEVSGEVAGLAR